MIVDDFKRMPKMHGCACTVPRMKTGGYVSKAIAAEDQGFKPMKKAVGGLISLLPEKLTGKPALGSSAAPGKPSMAARREAMKVKPKAKPKAKLDVLIAVGKGKKEGGEVKESAKHEASEKKEVKAVKAELKSHEKKPASKAHKGLKYGGEVKKMADGGAVQQSLADVLRWNTEFQRRNNIPSQKMDNRGDINQALATQNYYKTIMGNNRGAGGSFFRSPDDSAAQAAALNAPRNFEGMSKAPLSWEQTGQGSSQAPAFVSSATPSGSGLGLVNARLASRNMPQQPVPVDNGNGGFGPPFPRGIMDDIRAGVGTQGQVRVDPNNPIGFLTQGGGGYNKYQPRMATVQNNRLVQGPTGMKNGGRVK